MQQQLVVASEVAYSDTCLRAEFEQRLVYNLSCWQQTEYIMYTTTCNWESKNIDSESYTTTGHFKKLSAAKSNERPESSCLQVLKKPTYHGYVSKQKCKIWVTESPQHGFHEKPIHPLQVTVRCSFDQMVWLGWPVLLTGVYFLKNDYGSAVTMNGTYYCTMITSFGMHCSCGLIWYGPSWNVVQAGQNS